MEPHSGPRQAPCGGARAAEPPPGGRYNLASTPADGAAAGKTAPSTAGAGRLMQLRRQLALETAKQDAILRQLGALLAKYQQLALHDGLRTAPFLSVPPTVRRYKSFRITLGAPKGWFERLGLGAADVCGLGARLTAVKASTLVEAVGCRCIRNTGILTVRTAPEQPGGDPPFLVRRYRLYDHYVWTDCRINCSSSRTHYASDLRLRLDVPGCACPVLSGEFAAVRMPKPKAAVTDKLGTFTDSIYRPVPRDAVVRMSGRTVYPSCALLHRKASYSPLLTFGVLSAISTERIRFYKAQSCGDLCCTFLVFDSLAQVQRHFTEFLNFVMNDSIFSNITGKNIGNAVLSGVVTQFGNFIDPAFDLNSDEVIVSYRNGTLTFLKPDVAARFYCYERASSACPAAPPLQHGAAAPQPPPSAHTGFAEPCGAAEDDPAQRPLAACTTATVEQPAHPPTPAAVLLSPDGERSTPNTPNTPQPAFTLPYSPSPLFARSAADSPTTPPSEGAERGEQFGFFGGVDAASLFEESQGGAMLPFSRDPFAPATDDALDDAPLALDMGGFLDDDFLVAQQQLADEQQSGGDRASEYAPLDSSFRADRGESGAAALRHGLGAVSATHTPADEVLAAAKSATKRVCLRPSNPELF